MSATGCLTISGPYGEFQLVDPMMRRPSGSLSCVIKLDDGSEHYQSVTFHFFFLNQECCNEAGVKELFERDLLALIGLTYPTLKEKVTQYSGTVKYHQTIFPPI